MKNSYKLFYVITPLLAVTIPFILYWAMGTNTMLKGETGIIENMTVLFLLISIGICLFSLSHARSIDVPLLHIWLIILMAGAIYFALEEVSYGQQIFRWNTPETWKNINSRNETNLHNTSAIIDLLPRILLQISIVIGGVALPIYRYFRGIKLDHRNWIYWLLPTSACLPVSLSVILLKPAYQALDANFISIGQMKEMLIALFILVYCISIGRRLRYWSANTND